MSIHDVVIYEVGGSVRDKLLGVPHHDYDYAVEAPSFKVMKDWLLREGYVVYVEKEEYGTIKARLPPNKKAYDFTLCRKDGYYSDHRRPDNIESNNISILEDLKRRDFSINAIAIDPNGNVIDPHNGIEDVKLRYIRCVGDTKKVLYEDPLRLLRAYRLSITKDLHIDPEIINISSDPMFRSRFVISVKSEMIQNELNKMLLYNPIESIKVFNEMDEDFLTVLFRNKKIKLVTTMKNKISTHF